MIVVDTNVLAYLLIPGEFSARADALFRRDPDWHVPLLWRSEFRNVLAGHMRTKNLALEAACRIHAEADDIVAGNEHEVDPRRVLALIRGSRSSAYDCEYVALADALGAPLVTMDSKLLKAFPARTKALAAR